MLGSGKVLVDTSAWIELFRKSGDAGVKRDLSTLILDGRAAWCDIVRLELWNGARDERERRDLADLEETVALVPTDAATWALSLDFARRARRAGLTAPAVDLLIAATARRHGMPIFHFDKHLDRLAKMS